jgi:hydrogenase maturation protease
LSDEGHGGCLIVGIGNVLMGDEGVGVHVIRALETMTLPEGVECLDGGTGGMHLLEFLQRPQRIIMVDATDDGGAPGTIRRLRPRYARDYPRSLTAHDIGLKDVLDALYLLGQVPDVTLFTVSIEPPGALGTDLSPPVAAQVPILAARLLDEATG